MKYNKIISDILKRYDVRISQISCDKAITFTSDKFKCRLENGERFGQKDTLLLLVELDIKKKDYANLLKLNFDYSLTLDGYVLLKDDDVFFARHIKIPDHSITLVNSINESVFLSKKIVSWIHK